MNGKSAVRWAIAAVALGALVVPSTVQAVESPGVLVVIPSTGDLETPIDVATVGVCERGTIVMVTVEGKGIKANGDEIIVGAIDFNWLEPNGYPSHQVSLSQTLGSYFFRAQVAKPRGDYTLTFVCRNRLDVEPLQTFTATLSIDAKGRYEVEGGSALDLDTAVAEADLDYETVPGSDDVLSVEPHEGATPDNSRPVDGEASLNSPDSSDRGNPAGAAGSEDGGFNETASPEVTEAAAIQQSSSDSLRGILLIGGAILLVGAMSAWFFMSRREKRSKDSERRDAEVDA